MKRFVDCPCYGRHVDGCPNYVPLSEIKAFYAPLRAALAAGSRRAKTPKAVECEASQSGGKAVTPAQSQPSSGSSA